jgi:hypothetical protein
MHKLLSLLVGIGFLAPLLTVQAQSAAVAGRVTLAVQEVVVQNSSSARSVERRAEIYVGETIGTKNREYAILRMSDTALLALSCSTTLEIERYSYEQSQSDTVSLNLIAGRPCTIVGSISAKDSTKYRLRASNSWVSSNAADFAAAVLDDDAAYFGVFDGSITLSNRFGTLVLGRDGDADFARVEPGEPPVALLIYPQQLNTLSISTNSTPNTANTSNTSNTSQTNSSCP